MKAPNGPSQAPGQPLYMGISEIQRCILTFLANVQGSHSIEKLGNSENDLLILSFKAELSSNEGVRLM